MTRSAGRIKAAAAELGFVACGVASLEPSRRGDALDRWLSQGYAGTMRYLHRQAARRKAPGGIVPEARVAVVVLENYFPKEQRPGGEERRVKVAKYAQGADYHRAMRDRLEELAVTLRRMGATVAKPYVDAGPVPERELAERAGLGWIAKNTMLIRPGAGSFFFIGTIFTDLDLAASSSTALDHCGSCTACLDACPTEAFVEPRVLDATRCISYFTIEHRGEIPEPLVSRFRGWGFGCDICQDVCPWNLKFAQPTDHAEYQERGHADTADPDYFLRLTREEFASVFGDTPLERPGLEGMRRNWSTAFASLATGEA